MQKKEAPTNSRPGEKIFLVGYRACGKTSVGRLLALRLGFEFLDMDTEIQKRTRMSIRKMVALHGWSYFRERERALLQELGAEAEAGLSSPGDPPDSADSAKSRLVVATGGGAVLQRDLWPQIKALHLVVWLKADPATIAARIRADALSDEQRPALTEQDLPTEIGDVLAQRAELYQQASHLQIDTAGTDLVAVVEQIIAKRSQRLREI